MSDPPTPKGRRTRLALLRAGRAVFGRKGFVATQMGDIAAEAGISLGGLYRYFSDKEHVFETLLAGIHEEQFIASRAQGVSLAERPYDAILAANAGFLSHYERNADLMRVLVEAAAVDRRHRDMWWEMRNKFVERFVRQMIESGLAPAAEPALLRDKTEALAFMVEQWAYVYYAHGHGHDIDKVARMLTDIWYAAFFAGGTPAGSHREESPIRTCRPRRPVTAALPPSEDGS